MFLINFLAVIPGNVADPEFEPKNSFGSSTSRRAQARIPDPPFGRLEMTGLNNGHRLQLFQPVAEVVDVRRAEI